MGPLLEQLIGLRLLGSRCSKVRHAANVSDRRAQTQAPSTSIVVTQGATMASVSGSNAGTASTSAEATGGFALIKTNREFLFKRAK